MLPKINGARRIRYQGDDLYAMPKRLALLSFPHAHNIEDIADSAFVVIEGVEKGRPGICASSDSLNDDDVSIVALFDQGQTWGPYSFASLHVAMAQLAVVSSGMADDSPHLFHKGFTEYIRVAASAMGLLEVRAAIRIFYNGLSDYEEAKDGTYHKTRFFSGWGEGEEKTEVSPALPKSDNKKPSHIAYVQKDIVHVLRAINNPAWQNVPYIKLMARDGEFLT